MDKPTFEGLSLSPEILKAVSKLGFEFASPIQAAAIPVLKSGVDVVGQSQTGSGKTAAFAIPALERLDRTQKSVQVLVLCPTRELASQVAEEFHKLSAYQRGVQAVPIYGGASYERQFMELRRNPQVVIGTPGRLIDHLERGTLKLDEVRTVILDEADRMLDLGFRDDIARILESLPVERQTVFFSATLSREIRGLIQAHARDPEYVQIETKPVDAPAIDQWAYEVPPRMKREALIRLLDYHGFTLGLVFCNTQRMVDDLADALAGQGIAVDRLHGGISQSQRTRVMQKFKKAEFEFLVATDVAARGIDVDHLQVVVNYDLPYDPEDYVHRIGRTGRAGRQGMAATFVSGREIYRLQTIERAIKTKIRRGKIPTLHEVEAKRTEELLESLRARMREPGPRVMQSLVDRLLDEGFNSTDIAAAALQLMTGAETPPVEEEPAVAAPRVNATQPSEAPPRMRPASRGFAWVWLDVGRDHDIGPREVAHLLHEGLGMEHRNVGIILLTETHSFAQIPEEAVGMINQFPNAAKWQDRAVTIQPWTFRGKKKAKPGKPKK